MIFSGSSRAVWYKFDKEGNMVKRTTWTKTSCNINGNSFSDENYWEEENPDFTEDEYNDLGFQAYIRAIKDGEFEDG